ncbi:uncharacterized protein BKA55DRAFT_556212 [Fusarium redolens]|uniref:Uncharacterized protein n=1 Tax=Fusarium redolens TaxID=48865 RepID=A0A9P9KSC3_FUSRE|nr:uncharacterized protein BKA55DRAFT_556212 [Fusarium redolens]KAH7267619.1 hypothetical protein BKA55DRAFT_556212 [Fusarium redolens]
MGMTRRHHLMMRSTESTWTQFYTLVPTLSLAVCSIRKSIIEGSSEWDSDDQEEGGKACKMKGVSKESQERSTPRLMAVSSWNSSRTDGSAQDEDSDTMEGSLSSHSTKSEWRSFFS